MRNLNLPTRPITLMLLAAIFSGCEKPLVPSANNGAIAGNMQASAMHQEVRAAGSPPNATHETANSRGELLYSTHCSACHTTEIHWREKKRVTDLNSLKSQVRRWQASIGLTWTEDEISDVASYLNSTYYNFKYPVRNGFLEGKNSFHTQNKKAEL